MTTANPLRVLLSAFMVCLAADAALAGDCCQSCGNAHDCCKVCRLEPSEKKNEIVCYGVKCEDFCVGGPSKPCCQHEESVCADCADKSGVCTSPKRFVWTEWIPGKCSQIFTRKKLMKRIETVKTPSYKWVVEDLCPGCEAACDQVYVPADAKIPPPPTAQGARPIPGQVVRAASPE